MTLPTTGPISISQVRTELSITGQTSLGQANVRSLAEKTSGQIAMSDLRGKSGSTTQGNLVIGSAGTVYGYNRASGGAVGYGAIGSLTPPNLAIGTNGQIVTAILCDQVIGLVRTFVYVSGSSRPNESKTLVIRNTSGAIISNLPSFGSAEFHQAGENNDNAHYLFYDFDSLPQSGTVNVSIE